VKAADLFLLLAGRGGSAPIVSGPAIKGFVRRDGKLFVDDGGVFRPLFFSALSILGANKPSEAFLNWGRKKGFNGFRVFAGNLTFDGATAAQARAALPGVLDMGKARGLRCEVTACTDTANMSKDEIRQHVEMVAAICAGRPEVFGLELGNELYHQTQNPALTDTNFLAELRDLARRAGYTGLIAYGAAQDDESTMFGGGDYVTVHLDRGRDMWNQVRRVREMQAVSDATGKAVVNNEPIGAAEPGTPGQRLNDPAAFLCLGALSRLFEVGAIYHFEDGLHISYPVGPTQDASADAFVRGFQAMDGYLHGQRSSYQNSNGHGGWASSPVQNFDEGRAVRAYAGINGSNGGVVIVGGDDPGIVSIGAGWRLTGESYGLPGCRVLEIVH
jgi:hypothetical protein